MRALLDRVESAGEGADFSALDQLLDLLPAHLDDDLGAALCEAASTWALVHGGLTERAMVSVVERLHAAAAAASGEVGTLAMEAAVFWQQLRIRSLPLESWPDWPLALRRLAPEALELDILALAELLSREEDAEVRSALRTALRTLKPPRRGSKARTALETTLTALGDPDVDALIGQWNNRRFRGTPKPDPHLPLRERLSAWVFAADERYDIPADPTPQQQAMFCEMSRELCGLRTRSDWLAAAAYFEAETSTAWCRAA